MGNPTIVYCPYCGEEAKLVDSSVIYKQSYGMMWLCEQCDAYTGCHKSSKTFKPLGTLAKKELRDLRKDVHSSFDPLWKRGIMNRSEAYAWLANQMNLETKCCHVAMFDESKCRLAISIIEEFRSRKNKIIS